MKQLLLLITAFGLSFAALPAQTVPVFLNYQGSITDGNGNPLGSTGTAPNFNAAPTNRKMIFRIFTAANVGTGTLLWSETQTVTISLGQFSVLLGLGAEVVYTAPPAPDPRPALHTVFTSTGDVSPDGPTRYLEIIVDNGDGTFGPADQPITPRQRLTTTAYSFRAMKADTVADGAITEFAIKNGSVTVDKLKDGAVGAPKLGDGSVTEAKLALDSVTGTKIKNGTIEKDKLATNSVDSRAIANGSVGTDELAPEAVTLAKLDGNSVDSSKIVDASIATADLADGAVTAVKLNASNVGIWNVAGANVSRPTGNVAIGVANTSSKLQVEGDVRGYTFRARIGVPGTGGTDSNGFAFIGNPATGLFSPVANELSLYASNSEKMRVLANGNVGIGTSTPAVRLDVVGNADITMTEQPYNGFDRTFSPGTGTEPWRFRHWGTDPGATVLEGIATYSTRGHRSNDYTGTSNGGLTQMTGNVGIRTDSWIATRMGLAVYSDRRIKKEFRANSPAQDLAAIRQLKVTDYRMVDHADGGTTLRRGFIAQEVEKIIPGAVTRSTEFVPDIFSRATELNYQPDARTLHVTLHKDHHLKVGDAVRLHVDGERLDLKVSAVPSVRSFEVAECAAKPAAVFVYGRKVDDFRTVDYDRIFTTSVGALQELKREKDAEVLALQEENTRLLARLTALEAKDEARESRLAAIEKQLSGQEDEIRSVSHKAAE